MKTFLICFNQCAWLATIVLSPSAMAHSMHDHNAHKKVGVAITPHEPLHENNVVSEDTSVDNIGELIQQYSLSGNDELLAQGQKLLQSRLVEPTPVDWLHAAWLAQAEHRFNHASEFVDKVLSAQPRNAQALLLQASIAMVQGKKEQARASCQVVTLAVDPVVGTACLARLSDSSKDQQQALDKLLSLPLNLKDPALRAWVTATIAELAAAVDQNTIAQTYFEATLSLQPSVQTRVAYADFLLSHHATAKVVELIGATEHAPALALRRIMALQRLGHNVSAQVSHYDQRFRTWHEQHDYRHAREMVMFYLYVLPNPPLARLLAKENLKLQQEPEDIALLQQSLIQS